MTYEIEVLEAVPDLVAKDGIESYEIEYTIGSGGEIITPICVFEPSKEEYNVIYGLLDTSQVL